MRPTERAAFYAAWREKKLRGLFIAAVGNSGNAASRVESFIYSKGSYAYGGYPDIDDLFLQQARERDPRQREALLHRIQQLTIDRVMFAPIMDLRALIGRRAARGRAHHQHDPRLRLPGLRGHPPQGAVTLHMPRRSSMKRSLTCATLLGWILTASLAFAQGLPTASPEAVGLSSAAARAGDRRA